MVGGRTIPAIGARVRTVRRMAADSNWPLAAALAVAFAVTLVPITGPTEVVPVLCLICGPFGAADFVLNLLLFLPIAYAASLRLGSLNRAMLLVIATTVGIELLQFAVPGRHPTLGDVAANSLGGAIGCRVALGRIPAFMRSLAPYAIAAVIGGTVWAFEPSLPDTVYYGQWTPRLAAFDAYDGRVLRAYTGSVDLPEGRLAAAVHASVRQVEHGVPITVEFTAGSSTGRTAPILRVVDDADREVVLVGSRGTSIVVRMRRIAQAWSLHAPGAVFPGLHRPPGTRSVVRFDRRDRELCVGTQETETCQSSLTPARGWFLLTGVALTGWAAALADAVWLGALSILLMAGPRGAIRALPAVVYLALWILLPGDFAWFAGLVGLLTGGLGIVLVDRWRGSKTPGPGSA